MKIFKFLEWFGFALIITGFLLTISEKLVTIDSLTFFYKQQELIYTLGMLFWALGYMITQNEKKKKTES